MRFTFLFIFLIFITLLTSCNEEVYFFNNGQSTYTLFIPKDTPEFIKKASSELQSMVYECTDIILPTTEESQAHQIEFRITENKPGVHYFLENNNIILEAKDSISLFHTLYEFAENVLGIRYLSPNFTHFPILNALKLSEIENYSHVPVVSTRTVHSKLFYENPEFALKHKVTPVAFPGYIPDMRVHTFHRLLPASQYFESHPEYYALRGNDRRTTQLCLTNPDVKLLVSQKLDSIWKANPDYDVLSVSQDDNTQYCQCEHCSKIDEEEGSPSGTMIRFVNVG